VSKKEQKAHALRIDTYHATCMQNAWRWWAKKNEKLTTQSVVCSLYERKQESPANAKGTRDSSACMKAHCEQM